MKPVLTDDGSLTYLHPTHGASYRSIRGAETESRWVFLQGSGITTRSERWTVLELGFGTGLNFQLTADAARQRDVALNYVSLEPDPMPNDLWLVEQQWRTLEWGSPLRHDKLHLSVHKSRWQDWSAPPETFDAIYFDPFGPAVAPDCWSEACFSWASRALRGDGVLATYGASSAARHAMKAAGLSVGILPGAPGKREMTVAGLTPEAIDHAKPWKRTEGRLPEHEWR